MPVDLGKVRKPLRDLRKSLKNLPSNPSMRAVHDLRTTSRRLEAIVLALAPNGKLSPFRLLKAVKPLRKAAGQVRDMDVLAAKAHRLFGTCPSGSVERLLEYLHTTRSENAQTLLDTIADQRKRMCRRLDRISHQLESTSHDGQRQSDQVKRLIHELMHWPALGAENLHAFRLKVKELRYVLQLAANSDPDFMKALDAVKTRVGDWHDWQQLAAIAHQVLNRSIDRKAVERIVEIEKEKLEPALRAARTIRMRFLGGQSALPPAEP